MRRNNQLITLSALASKTREIEVQSILPSIVPEENIGPETGVRIYWDIAPNSMVAKTDS
jgi:hypothetical protein